VKVACAELFSAWLAADPPSTLSDTVTVGVPEGDVTVNVTDPFTL